MWATYLVSYNTDADLNSAFRHVHNNKLLISISFTHDINYNSLHINPPK